MSPETDCGICGEREAKVCARCFLKETEALHARITELEKRVEALEGYIESLHGVFVKEASEG